MQMITRILPLGAMLALTVATTTACPAPPGDQPAEGEGEGEGCGSDRDCAGGQICDKEGDGDDIPAAQDPAGICQQVVCLSDADCDNAEIERCDARRGICVFRNLCDPGDVDACPDEGDVCTYSNGGQPTCGPAPAATACVLSPAVGYVVTGDTIQIEGVGTDAGGKLVPQTKFTWAASTGAINAAGVLTAGDAGTTTVTGTTVNGGVDCTASIVVYDGLLAGDSRVVVIDQTTREPLAGVAVAATIGGINTEGVTEADGSFTFTAGALATALSVFPDGHQWHTLIGPPDDVIIYTAPIAPATPEVDGIKGDFDFTKVHTKGDIRLGLAGTAINAAITDLNFNTIIGESVDTTIDIEGITDAGGQVVPLPEGLVIGLGDENFKGTYSSINDKAGPSVGWALAGQVQLSKIGSIISTVASDTENINAGAILAAVLPFFATFDHAIVTGLDFDPAARAANDPNFDTVKIIPDTLLAASAEFDAPELPCAPGGFGGAECDVDLFALEQGDVTTVVTACPVPVPDGATCDPVSSFASGAVVISGVVVPGIGLVPLGLSAGLDDTSEAGNNFDGILEQSNANGGAATPGKLLMDYAPPHDGVEGNLYLTVAIALDINSITSTDDLGASIITQVSRTLPEDGNTFSGNTWLQSQGGTYNVAEGTFSIDADGAADFYRVNLDDGNDDNGEAEWNVWFSADDESFDIDDLPTHADVGAAEITERTGHADIQAFGLGTGYDGPVPADFDELFAFDGKDLDNLLYYLGAWSSESCKANGHCAAE